MNTKARIILIIALALLVGAALVVVTWAAPGNTPLAPGGSPTVVAYQGEVHVGGTPYDGDGYFKYAVVNTAGTASYWSNDGTSAGGSEPTAAVQLAVNDGLFSVLLGDTTLTGMSQAMTAGVFSQPDRYLRVWFSDDNITFDQLTPDTRIAAVPYALQAQEAADADTVDGLHASELETHYQNVVVVAKSGGDYTSVQAAIASITDAADDNPYLVWVAPGVYSETVTMKPYVHLQGAGQEATVITSTASSSAWPPDQATLTLASDTSLRDLTLGNGGAGTRGTALLATAGMTRTLVADVTARALGGGTNNFAIFLSGSGTGVTLRQVTALAENGSGLNSGLISFSGAAAMLYGGNYTARGGANACGIFSTLTVTMKAENVTALGEDASNNNYGLNNSGGAAVLRGSSFVAHGGTDAYGIYNAASGTTLETESVTALGENGSINNFGLENSGGAAAVLRGGSFTARGGTRAYGIFTHDSGTTLQAESVTALGEDGSTLSYGMENFDGGMAVLRGGSFTGRGGTGGASGIQNTVSSTLTAEGITALAEDGSTDNHGLYSYDGVTTTLCGGSFTGRGGTAGYGIYNRDNGATLEADNITALGEDGSGNNYGLGNSSNAEATLRGGSFTGNEGTDAYGIHNTNNGTTLEAANVTALGEDGSFVSAGLVNETEAAATLRGGAFTGRAGTYAFGVVNYISTTMEAEGVTALGENGSTNSCGMVNTSGATATLRGGSFTGSGGVNATGIDGSGSVSRLEVESVTALGENGSNNRGLQVTGTADVTHSILGGAMLSVVHEGAYTTTISHSRLVGGAASGNVTCVLVTRGTTISTDGSTCP